MKSKLCLSSISIKNVMEVFYVKDGEPTLMGFPAVVQAIRRLQEK